MHITVPPRPKFPLEFKIMARTALTAVPSRQVPQHTASTSPPTGPTPAELRKLEEFAKAIRKKAEWRTKILDKDRDLGLKWAIEAGFFTEEDVQKGTIDDSHWVMGGIR